MSNEEVWAEFDKQMRRIKALEKEVVRLHDVANENLTRIQKMTGDMYRWEKAEEEEAEGEDFREEPR